MFGVCVAHTFPQHQQPAHKKPLKWQKHTHWFHLLFGRDTWCFTGPDYVEGRKEGRKERGKEGRKEGRREGGKERKESKHRIRKIREF